MAHPAYTGHHTNPKGTTMFDTLRAAWAQQYEEYKATKDPSEKVMLAVLAGVAVMVALLLLTVLVVGLAKLFIYLAPAILAVAAVGYIVSKTSNRK